MFAIKKSVTVIFVWFLFFNNNCQGNKDSPFTDIDH